MKFFSWMHNKLKGKEETKKENSATTATNHQRQDSLREEFSDWPQSLLAIGTLGNENNLKQELDKAHSSNEVDGIQKEIKEILNKKVEDDEKSNQSNEDNMISRLERSTSVVLNREKDIRTDQTKGSIGKKSLSFILKKMFVCGSDFVPNPSLRDTIPDKSRMEKILRAILHKKIYPQNTNPKATAKKYLEDCQLYNSDEDDDDILDAENDGSKWVKTDSDFIVLEI